MRDCMFFNISVNYTLLRIFRPIRAHASPSVFCNTSQRNHMHVTCLKKISNQLPSIEGSQYVFDSWDINMLCQSTSVFRLLLYTDPLKYFTFEKQSTRFKFFFNPRWISPSPVLWEKANLPHAWVSYTWIQSCFLHFK